MENRSCLILNGIGFNPYGVCCGKCDKEHCCEKKNIQFTGFPPEVMEECRTKSEGLWENGKPKKWYYAIPIILFWILIVALIVKAIISAKFK